MASTNRAERKRGGCLTAFLILAFIGFLLGGVYYLLAGSEVSKVFRGIPAWFTPVLGLLCLIGFGFALAIWKWKKWGVYGYFGLAVVSLILNFTIMGPAAVIGLIGPGILAALVFPRVWDQMD